jgi:hypothetical protein
MIDTTAGFRSGKRSSVWIEGLPTVVRHFLGRRAIGIARAQAIVATNCWAMPLSVPKIRFCYCAKDCAMVSASWE